jgi:hypothetical protein
LTANAGHVTDNFTVSVKQGVFVNGVSGNLFTEYTVDRTWLINEAVAGGSNVNVTLQWNVSEELSRFKRAESYIIQHNGTSWQTITRTAATGSNPYTQIKNGVTSFSVFAVQTQPIPDAPTGIYPNPVSSILNVVVRPVVAENMTLTVYDGLGKVMMVKKESVLSGTSLLNLDVSRLAAGIYTLKVSTERDREFLVTKFFKVN